MTHSKNCAKFFDSIQFYGNFFLSFVYLNERLEKRFFGFFAVVYVWDKIYFLTNFYLVYIEAGNPVGKYL